MSTSLIYRSARGYELLMHALYGRHYAARMRSIAAQVPSGASVLELCCGPGTLYLKHLRGRVRSYVGLDVNEGFIERLRQQGVDARVRDLSDGLPLPQADVVIMQASLYHFLPRAQEIVGQMVAAAGERVIISEPVRNLATSGIPGVALLGKNAADPGVGGHAERFTEETLAALMDPYRDRVIATFAIPGGRERVYVLAGGGAAPPGRDAST